MKRTKMMQQEDGSSSRSLEPPGDDFVSGDGSFRRSRKMTGTIHLPAPNEPERAAFFSARNVVNVNRRRSRGPTTTTFLNVGGGMVESSSSSGRRGDGYGGGLARMKYDSFTGRNSSNNNAPTATNITPATAATSARTTYERRRPSPTTTRPKSTSLRMIKQQESQRMMSQKSCTERRIKNLPRSRPCDSKSRGGFDDCSSRRRPGAVAVIHHPEDVVTPTNCSGSSNSTNEYDDDDDDGPSEYFWDQQVIVIGSDVAAESPTRSTYHSAQEMQHVQPPGVMHAIQKPSLDAEHGVVELVFPDDHPHIHATLVDPNWERERIREEIEQQAPRALVVSDCDDEHNKTRMRGWSRRTLCILAVLLLALSGLAVGIINGINLIVGGSGREDSDASSVPTDVSHTTTTTTANPNDPTTTAGTSSTTTTDSNVIPAFKDLGDTCKTPEQVTNLPYTYSANTTLVEAQELACPTILTYFYARWFHITPLTMAAADLSIDTNDSSAAAAVAASLPFSSSCITATTEGLDGFVVSMNVYQGTCDSLSCILATLAPTSAPDPPTAAPSPGFEEQPDGENVQIHNSSSSTSPWPTPTPVVKPPPFFVSKKTRSQVSWSHYDANGNFTLLVSWPAATFGNFELNITVSDCSSLE